MFNGDLKISETKVQLKPRITIMAEQKNCIEYVDGRFYMDSTLRSFDPGSAALFRRAPPDGGMTKVHFPLPLLILKLGSTEFIQTFVLYTL